MPGALVRFERFRGRVTVYIDGDLFHAFDEPLAGQVFADVTLYDLADFVDNPEIGALPVGISGIAPAARNPRAGRLLLHRRRCSSAVMDAFSRSLVGVDGFAPAAVGYVGELKFCGIAGRGPVRR